MSRKSSARSPFRTPFATILGFFIVGFRTTRNGYWRHLLVVMLLVWAGGLVSVAFFGVNWVSWFFGIIPVALFMGIGGGLRLLARPRQGG